MHATVTQLDRMLYAWLAETDDRRFDQAFERYYAAASTHVARYLARRSSLPDLDCEQIAVDALLKFFCRVGRDRRQAAASIGATLPHIQPLNLGPFHVRQVQRWTAEIGTFKQASMGFNAEPDATGAWKSQIQALSDTIAPLQRQGCHLLEAARIQAPEITTELAPGADDDGSLTAEREDSSGYGVLRAFADALRNAGHAAAGALNAESRHPGLRRFVDGSWTVVEALPLLRVPTNGYLFDIAQSLYLDECKARGRKKRGGSGYAALPTAEERSAGAAQRPSPFALDDTGWPEEDADGSGETASSGFGGAPADIADPTLDGIDEDFCEQFYAYLRKPLEDAEEAFRQASARGRADAERKRLESIAKKNERLMTVLAMRIEGRTQEAIAETLGISRNQVKYIVELVQSAYEQFCAAAARAPRP